MKHHAQVFDLLQLRLFFKIDHGTVYVTAAYIESEAKQILYSFTSEELVVFSHNSPAEDYSTVILNAECYNRWRFGCVELTLEEHEHSMRLIGEKKKLARERIESVLKKAQEKENN